MGNTTNIQIETVLKEELNAMRKEVIEHHQRSGAGVYKATYSMIIKYLLETHTGELQK